MKHLPFVVSTAGLLFAAGCGGDTVQVSGGDGSEDGVLLDGTAAGNPHIYDRATGADGAAIAVGPYDASPGEVIAYTVGHAPAINTPTAWTSSDDNITFGFGPKYRVRFQNWIVQGPFATGQTRAVNACIRTSQIWRDER